ncbi:MAG TPA: universal stress protein [Thermodesulfobacteriota bacterium]
MAEVRRLLAASDLSAGAGRALARAVELASRHRARLTVLHVVEAGAEGATPQMLEAQANAAEAALRLEIDPLLLRFAGSDPLDVDIRVVPGRDFEQIIEQARADEADLVVLGARGAHSVRDLFVGTTAERVLRLGDRPVLVVKRVPRNGYRRVLVPVDFSEASRLALDFALALAPTASIRVLHVVDPGLEPALRQTGATDAEIEAYRRERIEAGERDLARFLEGARAETAPEGRRPALDASVESGRPEAVIPAAVRRLRANLVVMGTRGRTASPRLLLGSVAEHVVRDARCDVLAVRSAPAEPWRPVAW